MDTNIQPERALGKWLSSISGGEAPAVASSQLEVDLYGVIREWVAMGSHSPQSLERMGEVAVRFARRLVATGRAAWDEVVEQDCADFIEARVAGREASVSTLHFRRTTVRTVFRTLRGLGIVEAAPTVDLVLPPRGVGGTRPLVDDEIALLRVAASTTGRDRGRNATVLALAEATAISSEIALVSVDDLDSPTDPRTVRLPGNRRARPRTAPLTEWGRAVLANRVRTRSGQAGDRLATMGKATAGEISAQASVCNAIGVLLDTTGLGADADVRPASIRYWAGRAMYERGASITDVANALGARSLDATATAIGLDWQENP